MKKINVITDKGGVLTVEKDVGPNKRVKLEEEISRAEIRAAKAKTQNEIWEKARKEKAAK